MRPYLSRAAWLLFTTGVFALAGCMSVADPTKYYVLSATPLREPAPSASVSNTAIGVGPVLIPGYLDRVQIVTRSDHDAVEVAMYDRGAEPLESGIAQVLADNLSTRVGSERIAVFPWRGGVARVLDYQLAIVVLRFASSTGAGDRCGNRAGARGSGTALMANGRCPRHGSGGKLPRRVPR